MITMYHGDAAHFAGSYRVLNRTDSRRMVSMCGSVRQAHHPTPYRRQNDTAPIMMLLTALST